MMNQLIMKPMRQESGSPMVLPCEGHGQYSRYGQPVKAKNEKGCEEL
jgi:hypothetical protein